MKKKIKIKYCFFIVLRLMFGVIKLLYLIMLALVIGVSIVIGRVELLLYK